MRRLSFQIPIAAKLITITLGLLFAVSSLIIYNSTKRFEEISKLREKDANQEASQARATEVENLIGASVERARGIASMLLARSANEVQGVAEGALNLSSDPDLVAVEVISLKPEGEPNRVVNEDYLKAYGLDKSFIRQLREIQKVRQWVSLDLLFGSRDGHLEVHNSSVDHGAPLYTVGFQLAKDPEGQVTHVVLADLRLDRLQRVFASDKLRTLYLVDARGQVLVHPDEQKTLEQVSLLDSPIVRVAQSSDFKKGDLSYVEAASQKSVTSAYAKTSLGLMVIAEVPDEVILEPARAVKREALYIAGRILSVALFLVFVFSITLTSPIENLAALTSKIAKGDFGARASVRSGDEVGQLGQAFNQMIDGLVERDRVKKLFNKFHGSSVAEDLLKGDLHLGGSKKVVTVFFSDIRDFTKFSEAHTPEQVVEMLNEYFEIMVKIINSTGGVVDKFIGDAIMAVWGAPTPSAEDSHNAVRACLMMREALALLNEKRAERGQTAIRIGMGLHRGEVISGTIGSDERMEYTVIGDTVNQASRIESSTKALGADLLLSEDLAVDVQDSFLLEEAGLVEVKGKQEPIRLFKVRGYFNQQQEPVLVSTPYSDSEPEASEKVRLAV